VFKVGHAHAGVGKLKVENASSFQDVTSLLGMYNTYCTVEPYIDAKFDLHVQKIGTNYKALMRKSLSGNWKTNIGQSILEEIPVTEKHKIWIDAVSEMFGGLGICSLEAVVGKDGKENIIEVNDSATTLLGESQEEDRRNISELVFAKMEEKLKIPDTAPETAAQPAPTATDVKTEKPFISGASRTASKTSLKPDGPSSMASTVMDIVSRKQTANAAPAEKEQRKASSSSGVSSGSSTTVSAPPSGPPPLPPPPKLDKGSNDAPSTSRARHDSQDSTDSSASESSTVSEVSSASSSVKKSGDPEPKASKVADAPPEGPVVEGEDTMKNLRKTFAGIFGDIQ